jgi:hypothetical protein
MKITSTNCLTRIFFFATSVLCLGRLQAQTIHLVPNSPGQYTGAPIIYKDKLYLRFGYPETQIGGKLVEYNGGKFRVIPNPEGVLTYLGSPFIFKDKLYLIFLDSQGGRLGQFDSERITLMPNPNIAHPQFLPFGYPVICKDKMYFQLGQEAIAEFDGSQITILPQPDRGIDLTSSLPVVYQDKIWLHVSYNNNGGGMVVWEGGKFKYVGHPQNPYGNFSCVCAYKGKLIGYVSSSLIPIIPFEFDGKNFSRIQPPANISYDPAPMIKRDGDVGYYPVENLYPIILNEKLYNLFRLINVTNGTFAFGLGEWDGNSLRFLETPGISVSFLTTPIFYDQKLFVGTSNNELAFWDGSQFNIVPGTGQDSHQVRYNGFPIIFNDRIYIKLDKSLGVFNGKYVFKVNCDAQAIARGFNNMYSGYDGPPIVYDHKLFISLNNTLAYVDDK